MGHKNQSKKETVKMFEEKPRDAKEFVEELQRHVARLKREIENNESCGSECCNCKPPEKLTHFEFISRKEGYEATTK